MAGKMQGGVVAGTTAFSMDLVLRSSVDGSGVTGKLAADCTASYWRQGEDPVAITLSDLSTLTDAFNAGGFLENTDHPGSYRLDLPDAAVGIGADWVEIHVATANAFAYKERFPLAVVGTMTEASIAQTVLTTTMAESYAVDGGPMTLAQALYMIWSTIAQKDIAGVTMTTRGLDGSTAVMTFTLNSSTNPTSITRSS